MARPLRFVLGMAACALALPALHCNPANGFEEYDANPPPPPPDVTPPTFAGPRGATAVDEHSIQVTWDAATDDQSTADQISYQVFISTTADGIDYKKPALTTPAGATGALLPGLKAAVQYFVAVRASDHAGNREANETVLAATTPDKTPPNFDGVTKVTGASSTSLRVEWNAAKDEGSPTAAIRYAIYVATTSGAQDFKSAALLTTAGATFGIIDGLVEAKKYYVVVRAIDAAGNIAASTVEVAGSTLDVTPPTFAGVTSASAVGTSIKLTWPAASDLIDPASAITYDIYQGITAGGIDFTKPNYKVTGVLTYTVTGLDPSKKYFFIVRARDTSGNEETNIVEVSATTAASADTKPPVFGGVASATAASRTSLSLAWADAADDYSPAANITYNVYVATSAGAEVFTSTTRTTVGKTSYTVTGLTAGTTYYVVVRAMDEALNEEKNVIEKSATTLP
jgi:hypothetical protein